MNDDNEQRGKFFKRVSMNKKKNIVIIGAILLVLSSIFIVYSLSANKLVKEWNNRIYLGVEVQNIDLGGMEKEEAKEKLSKELESKLLDKKIIVKIDELEFELPYSEISPTFDLNDVVDSAMNFGKNGSILKKYAYIKNNGKEKYEMDLKLLYDEEKLKAWEESINNKIKTEPKDATLSINGRKFSVVNEVIGKSINIDEFHEKLKDAIATHINDDAVVSMNLEVVQPKIKSDDLSKINGIIGSYSSNYGASSEGRSSNIELATKAINGTILMPGEEFSFNEIVGPRTTERGYKKAATYVGNKIEPGIGGGICQVSTALYRAIMHGNIRSTERRNHSMSVGYAKPGLDATVSYGDIDYKFKNIYNSPIYIEGNTYNKVMTYNVYGNIESLSGKTYDMENEILQTIDPTVKVIDDSTLPVGKEVTESAGMTGYKVNSYQLTYENGVQTSKELIATDYYTAVDTVVKKGTQPLVPETQPAQVATEAPSTTATETPVTVQAPQASEVVQSVPEAPVTPPVQ